MKSEFEERTDRALDEIAVSIRKLREEVGDPLLICYAPRSLTISDREELFRAVESVGRRVLVLNTDFSEITFGRLCPKCSIEEPVTLDELRALGEANRANEVHPCST